MGVELRRTYLNLVAAKSLELKAVHTPGHARVARGFSFVGYIVLAVGLFFGLGYGLGSYALLDVNEGLYAQAALEMFNSHHWIIPHVNHVPYLEKPPLLYWLIAVAFQWFGVSAFSARLVPALAGLAGCLTVVLFARRMHRPAAGLYAALVMTSNIGYVLMARVVMFDMLLTALFTLTLTCFFIWQRERRPAFIRLAYAFLALAVLAKGLLSLALAPLIAFIFMISERDWQGLKQIFDPVGVVLFIAVALPWHVLAMLQDRDFTGFYFYSNQILRFLGTRLPADYYIGPVYYYVPRILMFFLPWSVFIPALALRRKGEPFVRDPLEKFLWIWFLVLLVFFSASTAKANYYLVIGVPPLALLVGLRIDALLRHGDGRALAWSVVLLLAVLAAAFVAVEVFEGHKEIPYTPIKPDALAVLAWSALLAFAALALACSSSKEYAIYVLALLIVPFVILSLKAIGTDQDYISSRAAVAFMNARAGPNYKIVLYKDYEEISALPFYAGRRVAVLDSASNDLRYGAGKMHEVGWFMDAARFRKEAEREKLLVVVRQERLGAFERDFAARGGLCLVARIVGPTFIFSNEPLLCAATPAERSGRLYLQSPSAVDCDHLASDVARFHQEHDGVRHVQGVAAAVQHGARDDAPSGVFVQRAFRPQDGAGGHRVDAYLGTQLAGQRAGLHRETRFGDAVHRVVFERPLAVDVHDVDDAAALRLEVGRRGLGQKERRLEISAQQVVPVRLAHGPQRGGVKVRGVVNQHVEPAPMRRGVLDGGGERRRLPQVRLHQRRRVFAQSVQRVAQRACLGLGTVVMQHQVHAAGMQRPRDGRADTPRRACDECRFSSQCVSIILHGAPWVWKQAKTLT